MNKPEEPRLGSCACRNLRMTTRVLTQFYDDALRSAGLKATQFSLLNEIAARQQGTSVNELADLTRMDQTTVTRNLELLHRKGYIHISTDVEDNRRRCVTISDEGRGKIAAAQPLWAQAQRQVEQTLGPQRYRDLLETLALLQELPDGRRTR